MQDKKYIEENYVQPDLNVASIAQIFGFNASYLSRLFKAETDINLIDYINECRMKKQLNMQRRELDVYNCKKCWNSTQTILENVLKNIPTRTILNLKNIKMQSKLPLV